MLLYSLESDIGRPNGIKRFDYNVYVKLPPGVEARAEQEDESWVFRNTPFSGISYDDPRFIKEASRLLEEVRLC